MIYVESKRKKEENLRKKFPTAKLLDITSKAENSLVQLSPFYPHGDIPIPFSKGLKGQSVEGIWQGLKVFQNEDIDPEMFENRSMKNMKRTVRKFGTTLGHRKGVNGEKLIGYLEARLEIYLPSYLWVLENKVQDIVTGLKKYAEEFDLVLLDYNTNCSVANLKTPLSHAFLVKSYLDNNYPTSSLVWNEAYQIGISQLIEGFKQKKEPEIKEKGNNKNQEQLTMF